MPNITLTTIFKITKILKVGSTSNTLCWTTRTQSFPMMPRASPNTGYKQMGRLL